MSPDWPSTKYCNLDRLPRLADELHAAGRSIVLCHGCFDIVHPGHLRYLQFARQQGDILVVSITGDDAIEKGEGMRPYVPQELRAESLAVLELVDYVVVVDGPTAEPVIRGLRPTFYIKGHEYEGSAHAGFLAERKLVEELGGRVIFSSGDVTFSSSAIIGDLGAALDADGFSPALRWGARCRRWGLSNPVARRMIYDGFGGLKVAVIGDAMCDRYVFCEATDVAGEAPVLSLRPLGEERYLGGAAIIAAHVKALGAEAHLFTGAGPDAASRELLERLDQVGIQHTTFALHQKLPTKVRYLVETQKLLKIDEAEARPMDSAMQRQAVAALAEAAGGLDAVIFADFGYGTLTATLVQEAITVLRPHVRIIAGDVSGARRTLLAYAGADLLTPHERELRGVLGDFENSLPTLASRFMEELRLPNLAVTTGSKGCVLFRPRQEGNPADWFKARLRSEYLPSLAGHVVDPVGAGDALLATATLAMTAGASLPQAGYLGSAAAAIAIGRLGNQAVSAEDLWTFLRCRPELMGETVAAAS